MTSLLGAVCFLRKKTKKGSFSEWKEIR